MAHQYTMISSDKRLIYEEEQASLQLQDDQSSPVAQLFNNRSVFITGASGFIGRVLLEKLLRCYPTIKRVYILLRPKRNVQPLERLHNQLLKVPLFNSIRAMKNGDELLNKIRVIEGDIGEENWGISEEQRNELLGDLSLGIVFHSAATVRFDEPIKTSIKLNLAAVDTLIKLCKQMPNLVALCHVSSAYVNSNITSNEDILEQIYPLEQTPKQVLQMNQAMNDELMQTVCKKLVKQRPNTYTYTKALAEHLLAREASDLPVAIVRPSIVVSAWKEPISGWIDNLNGPTGLVLAYGKGLLRTMRADVNSKADIVPVDIVINCMIAAAHYAAQSTRANNKQLPIFHCTSGDINPFTWADMENVAFKQIAKFPSQQILRYPGGTFKSSKMLDSVVRLFVHYLPALMIDLLCFIVGKKQQILSIYQKLHGAIDAMEHFSINNYNFKSHNINLLQANLSHPKDRLDLYMDIRHLDWDNFWANYVLGMRRFVLKEADSSLEEARRSFQRAYYKELVFRLVLALSAIYCLAPFALSLLPDSLASV